MLDWLASLMRPLRTGPTAATRIADLQDGRIVRVAGRARGYDGPIPLPLSGGDAATLTLRVYQYRTRSGLGQGLGTPKEPALVDDIDRGQTFWLDDGTGLARVERQGWSELVACCRMTIGSGLSAGASGERASASIERYVRFFGEDARNVFRGFGGDYEYNELSVPEGARVEVVGRARRIDEADASAVRVGYREAPRTFVIEPPEQARLRIWVKEVPR